MILCKIGIHEWIKWVETGTTYTKKSKNMLGDLRNLGTAVEMKRKCLNCGKLQLKAISPEIL